MLDPGLKRRLLEHYDWDKAAGFVEVRTGNVLTEKPHTNPPLRWKRVRKQCIMAIEELALLAETLPEDKRAELFTPDRVASFLQAVLGTSLKNNILTKIYFPDGPWVRNSDSQQESAKAKATAKMDNERAGELHQRYLAPLQNNLRITEIAANIARQGLEHCISEYSHVEPDTVLQRPITEAMETASRMTYSVLGRMKVSQDSAKANRDDR